MSLRESRTFTQHLTLEFISIWFIRVTSSLPEPENPSSLGLYLPFKSPLAKGLHTIVPIPNSVPKGINYKELLLEETKLKSKEGYEIEPLIVDFNKEPEIYTLGQLL